MRLGETAQRILDTMKVYGEPMTITMIAREMRVTPQTVRNHKDRLQANGYIDMYDRLIGGATAFVLTDGGSSNRLPISWNDGTMIPIREILEQTGKDGISRNPFWANLQMVIVKLYTLSLMSVDDENPQSISIMEIKELQKRLNDVKRQTRMINDAITDLLALNDLWIPKELPKALIIKDNTIDLEYVRSIIDRLNV